MIVHLARAAALAFAAAIAVAPAAAAASSPARAAELVLDAEQGFAIDATINGHPVRLRVDPEASGYVILNPATVERIGLRRSMIGSQTRIGPIRLTGSSKVARLALGAWQGDRRMVWIDRPATIHADGLIGPADLPYDVIRFRLTPPRAGETAYTLPLDFERSSGLFLAHPMGDARVNVRFSLSQPFTMATAAAGARIAELHGGAWTGEAQDRLINFGITRPVRPLGLARPLSLDGFALDGLLVRTADNRGNLELPPEPDADPDEIVVSSASRQRARYWLTIGLDTLSRCSTLEWDNRSRRMTLTCTG